MAKILLPAWATAIASKAKDSCDLFIYIVAKADCKLTILKVVNFKS